MRITGLKPEEKLALELEAIRREVISNSLSALCALDGATRIR